MRLPLRFPTALPRLPLLALLLLAGVLAAGAQGIKTKRNYIRVDQFGYTPEMAKVAVIADAVNGFNADYGIDLNAGVDVTLRRAGDNSVVKRARASAWNGGATDGQAGDRGWWFDFSDVTAEGEYYVQVTENSGNTVNSNRFRIADDVYAVVLRRAMQMFYYQRSNYAKTGDFAAGSQWTDGAWYNGSDQDLGARFHENSSSPRDMRGGWIDAGDPNKYVSFAGEVVHNLLTTYEQHPDFWDDFDLEIPESNNAVADLLDEINYEVAWIRRMQADNGGVYNKVGILNDFRFFYPPSTDARARFYEVLCPHSSVIAAGMLAHAAAVYRDAGAFSGQISGLTSDAEAAWTYYQNSSDKGLDCDGGEIEAGDGDGPGNHYSSEHQAEAAVAAAYLYQLTGKDVYKNFFRNNYTRLRPFTEQGNAEWAIYRSSQGEAALNYARLPNAEPAVRDAIIAKKTSDEKSTGAYYRVDENSSLYRARAYFLNWGSNSLLSREAYHNFDFINYDLRTNLHDDYRARAGAIINYMHGVNPFGMVYLTNMYGEGAEYSADEIYHTWFYANTEYDNIDGGKKGPPPGFLQGGANTGKNNDGSYYYSTVKVGTDVFGTNTTVQPDLKRFSVSNEGVAIPGGGGGGGYEQPYAFNEPAIYYQASYVKALANFVAGATIDPPVYVDDIVATEVPESVAQGQTVTVNVTYGAAADRDIIVQFQRDNKPYTTYGRSIIPVTAGEGTLSVDVTIDEDTPVVQDDYQFQVYIAPRGKRWADRIDNLVKRDLDVTAAVSLTDDVQSSSQPGSVTTGQTVNVSVDYESSQNRDILVYLETNGDPWTRYAEGRVPVSAGAGTVTVPVAIPATLATGNDLYKWQTLITTRGGDWGERRDNIARAGVDAVAPAPATRTDWIYREGLRADWANWSWGGTATPDDGLAYAGSKAFKYDFNAGGGAVSFKHDPGKTGDDLVRLQFFARTWSGDASVRVTGSYDDDFANAGTGKTVTITPEYQRFTVTKAELGGYGWFQRFFLRTTQDRTLFIDEVRLIYNDGSSVRLQATDFSSEAMEGDLSIAPNPTRGTFRITAAGDASLDGQALALVVYDVTGRQLLRRAVKAAGGQVRESVDAEAAGLVPGVYRVALTGEGGVASAGTLVVQ